MIRSLVPQQVASLRSICVKICDRADGVNVWAAWVLLIHMLSDPRLRKLVQASPITDHEVSAAYLFTNYARAEVTRRARMDQAANQKRAKTGKAVLREDAEAGPSGAMTSFARASGTVWHSRAPRYRHGRRGRVLRAGRRGRRRRPRVGQRGQGRVRAAGKAARKLRKGTGSAAGETTSRRSASSASDRPARASCRSRGASSTTGPPRSSSEYASILKIMITQSRNLANQASVATLTGQAPPGFNSERNALLLDISTRNAVKSAEALSGLVVTDARTRAQDRDVAVPQRRGPLQHAHGPRALVVRRLQHHRARRAHAARAPAGVNWAHQGGLVARHPQRHAARRVHEPRARASPRASRTCTRSPPASCRLRTTGTRPRAWSRRVKHRRSASACDGALDVTLTGVARSFIVHARQARGGRVAAARGQGRSPRACARRTRPRARPRAAPRSSDFESAAVTSEAALGVAAEPHATPSNNLALALEANEQSACSSSPRTTAAIRAGTCAAWPRPPS